MLKRLIAMLLAILMMLTFTAAIAEEVSEEETETEIEIDAEHQTLVVANPTVMRGEFFTEMWGNSTTDIE